MAEYAQTPIMVQTPYLTQLQLWADGYTTNFRYSDTSKMTAQQLKYFKDCQAEYRYVLSKTKPAGLDEYQSAEWEMAKWWEDTYDVSYRKRFFDISVDNCTGFKIKNPGVNTTRPRLLQEQYIQLLPPVMY